MLRPYLLHALSPLHAGTGHSADVIDLPIARMKGTNIPIAPGSSIKGVLRDARKPPQGANDLELKEKHLAVFGPDKDDAAAHAGALIVGDARLLALPVRSFKGVFAWVTSPLLLTLAKRDLKGVWDDLSVPECSGRGAKVSADCECMVVNQTEPDETCKSKVYLQDLDLKAARDAAVGAWADKITNAAFSGEKIFAKRFAVVDDDTMAFLWETATQVDQRIRIKEETRTVDKGALWREESLPPETLLIGILEAGPSRRRKNENGEEKTKFAFVKMGPKEVMDFALEKEAILQFGGKATIGRGRCRMIPVTA